MRPPEKIGSEMAGPAEPKTEPPLKQVADPERLQADQRRQADVRVEFGARGVDARTLRFGPQPCGDDVGPAADDIDAEVGRQAEGVQTRREPGG